MITRQWILWVVIVLQVLPLMMLLWIFVIYFGVRIPYGIAAEIGRAILLLWVSVSHLLLLRKYLDQRVSSND